MGQWAVGLFGCFSNLGLCIQSYFLPCLIYGKVSAAIGKSCLVHALFFFIPVFNFIVMSRTRGTLRKKRDIPGGCIGDLVLTIFCMGCTLSQEASEVRAMVRDKEAGKGEDPDEPGEPTDPAEPAIPDKPESEENAENEQPTEKDPVDIVRE